MAKVKQVQWNYKTNTTKSPKNGPRSKHKKMYRGQGK